MSSARRCRSRRRPPRRRRRPAITAPRTSRSANRTASTRTSVFARYRWGPVGFTGFRLVGPMEVGMEERESEGASASPPVSPPATASRAPGSAAPLLLDLDRSHLPPFEELPGAAGREHMHESCDDPGPAGLMARTEARSVVSMEVLVEQDQIPPVRVLLELPRASVHRPPPILVSQ